MIARVTRQPIEWGKSNYLLHIGQKLILRIYNELQNLNTKIYFSTSKWCKDLNKSSQKHDKWPKNVWKKCSMKNSILKLKNIPLCDNNIDKNILISCHCQVLGPSLWVVGQEGPRSLQVSLSYCLWYQLWSRTGWEEVIPGYYKFQLWDKEKSRGTELEDESNFSK